MINCSLVPVKNVKYRYLMNLNKVGNILITSHLFFVYFFLGKRFIVVHQSNLLFFFIGICDVANKYADNWDEFGREMNEELCCLNENDRSGKCYTVTKCSKCDTEGPEFGKSLLQWLHIPYLPLFHRPGWLMRYMVGPHDQELMNMLFADFVAGLTIALTYVPQALSYAKLANLPAINGLYACILPAAVYCFYGTSMQLAVGPVAIVSLLTGGLVSQYQPDFATNTVGAVDTAAQACLSVGIIMCCMSLLNLGSFIQFIAHPVMSGTTFGSTLVVLLFPFRFGPLR